MRQEVNEVHKGGDFMAYPLKSNPDGCCNPTLRGDRTCMECYWSQVKHAQWHGSQRCFNSNCLVLDEDRYFKNRKNTD